MRLRSVWISQYKNLRDFMLNFDGSGFIDIFVGKNGSGQLDERSQDGTLQG